MPRAVSIEEAIEIERKAHAMDIERRKRTVAKKKKQGLPIKGEVLTKVEADARVWAFM